ncbi:hypothetical protein PHYBOEH_000263 [Phytophthora boehmeriae]|uniref:Protein kinase domain-containing protein n=1 Tax=Phytophthora boehmeriae TaxID=109152 RepID=A0A8T1WXZ1_9STRA|nr:hypothetical protein PHYBOEH_000263 [Phytophthora boehmeriae]
MGNQPSVLGEEDATSRQNLRDGRNARVLDLPLDASTSVSAPEPRQSDKKPAPEASDLSKSSDQPTAMPSASPVAPRRLVTEFYDVQSELLGRGHYAVVNRGRCRRTGRPVAVKKIKRFLSDPKRLRAEIAALKCVKQHPNIVELIDVFETTREVHLVLELCTGGELFERLAEKGAYSEADCVRHVRDMARAIKYLHEDLKPENVLLSTPDDKEAVVKVADFGLAKVFTGTSLKTKCVDSWSLGTILYILLCGYHPFDPEGERSDNQMIASIKACSFEFDNDGWGTISEGAKDLVRHLLVLDPDDRFSMAQVLEHPWITGSSVAPASELPLSPSIHHELAKYREHTKQHKALEYDDA